MLTHRVLDLRLTHFRKSGVIVVCFIFFLRLSILLEERTVNWVWKSYWSRLTLTFGRHKLAHWLSVPTSPELPAHPFLSKCKWFFQ